MKKCDLRGVVAYCAALYSFVAIATDTTWTGAARNGLWTDSSNWTDGVPTADTVAVFGANAEGSPTTIDLGSEPAYCQSLKITGATAPAYTFGTGAEQQLVMMPHDSNWAGFTIEESVTADQTLAATYANSYKQWVSIQLRNDSQTAELKVTGKFNNKFVTPDPTKTCTDTITCRGKGVIRLSGTVANNPVIQVRTFDGGRAIWDYLDAVVPQYFQTPIDWSDGSKSGRRILEIAAGRRIRPITGGKAALNTTRYYQFADSILITGEGSLDFTNYDSGYTWIHTVEIADGKTATVEAPIRFVYTQHEGLVVKNGGTLDLRSTIANLSENKIAIDGTSALAAQKFGRKGCAWDDSSVGGGNVYFNLNGSGTLAYTGAGETTDRTVNLLNDDGTAEVTFSNRGTGLLEWTGAVSAEGHNAAVVVLDSQTAPMKLGRAALTNVSGIKMKGAATGVYETAADETLALTVESGTQTVVVNGAVTLAEASAVAEGAFVNFTFAEGATVKVPEGVAAARILVDGFGGTTIAADGTVIPGVTYWKTATSGTWEEAANWTAGVPTTGRNAAITADGPAYAVTLTTDVADAPQIALANATETAELIVKSAVTVSSETVDLQPGGKLTVGEGGKLTVAKTDRVLRNGGTLAAVSEGAAYARVIVPTESVLGSGRTEISGRANLKVGTTANQQHFFVAPTKAGERAELTFTGNAASYEFTNGILCLGNGVAGESILTFDNTLGTGTRLDRQIKEDGTTGDAANIYSLLVGSKQGEATLNLKGGQLTIGNLTAAVGTIGHDNVAMAYTDVNAGSGTVNQTGGKLLVYGWGYSYYDRLPTGLVIGDALRQMAPESTIRGVYNLAGGSIEVQKGFIIIGAGPSGTGLLNQTGGSVDYNATTTNFTAGVANVPSVLYVGLNGGTGTWKVSGSATARTRRDLYVGGVTSADVPKYYNDKWGYWLLDQYNGMPTSATGTLEIAGGTFTADNNVFLGYNGTGTIKQTGGSFAAKDVTVKNGAIELSATLAKDAFTVTGTLAFGENGKLVIDAADVSEGTHRSKLITAGAMTGLTKEKVELRNVPAWSRQPNVQIGATGVSVSWRGGLVLIFR